MATDSPSADATNATSHSATDDPQTHLVPITLPGLGDTHLDQSMVPRIQSFIENASAHGVNLHFNSAYRTPEHQSALRQDPNAITPATNSLHSAGFAVDVNYSSLPAADQEVIRNAASAAGLNWGGNFRSSDPPHFYVEPPVDRATAIANATQQYNEELSRQNPPAQPQDTPTPVTTPAPEDSRAPGHTNAQPGNLPSRPHALLQLDDPSHPDNALFCQAQSQVHALDARFNRVPDERSDRLAAALTVQAKANQLRGIHALVLSEDGDRAFVVDDSNLNNAFKRHAGVEIVPAMNQSIEQSSTQIAQVNETLERTAQEQNLNQGQGLETQQAPQPHQHGLRIA